MTFDDAFTQLLGNEGGYVDNPDDPGGETNWGITVAVARQNGYSGPMIALPKSIAQAIYQAKYWLPAHCDAISDPLQFQVFDAAVNSGVTTAITQLQLALGIQPDGIFGPQTLSAVQSSNPVRVAMRFLGHRLQFYTSLGTWPKFGKGWANRIASNLLKAGA